MNRLVDWYVPVVVSVVLWFRLSLINGKALWFRVSDSSNFNSGWEEDLQDLMSTGKTPELAPWRSEPP